MNNIEKSKAIFVVRTLEPHRGVNSTHHGGKTKIVRGLQERENFWTTMYGSKRFSFCPRVWW